jgi:hypothetical protein
VPNNSNNIDELLTNNTLSVKSSQSHIKNQENVDYFTQGGKSSQQKN